MDFARKKLRGQNQKVRRTWLGGPGDTYKIIWRKEVEGVRVPARFQAMVRIVLARPDGVETIWDFVSRQRLFKTLKAAQEACEKHERLWLKASESPGVRALKETLKRMPIDFPVWVRSKMSRRLQDIILNQTRVTNENDSRTDPEPPEPTVPVGKTRTRRKAPDGDEAEPKQQRQQRRVRRGR